jgi:hypothetical protein
MVADITDHLIEVALMLNGATLAALARRRANLERILAEAPRSTSDVIAETGCVLDALRARRTVIAETRDTSERSATGGGLEHGWEPGARRAATTIGHLDRSITVQEHKLDAAVAQQAARNEWLVEHADVLGEYEIVQRAQHVREARVRTSALHEMPEALLRVVGREPSSQRDRQQWRQVVEDVAVYRDRHGVQPQGFDGIEAVLGERPLDRSTRAEYAKTAEALMELAAVTRAAERSTGIER